VWTSAFLCVLLVGMAIFGIIYDSQFVRFIVVTTTVIIGSLLILSFRKQGPAGIILVSIGVITIIIGSIISPNSNLTEESVKPHLFWWDPQPQKILAVEKFPVMGMILRLMTGVLCISLGMLFAYKPGWIYVKNRPPFDYPFPIWQNEQEILKPYSNLVPLHSLLTTTEHLILWKYRYILVSIDNKPYLVGKDQSVPEDCIVIRTRKGNSICGV